METQNQAVLDFEKPIYELEHRLEELKKSGLGEGSQEIERLGNRLRELEGKIYANLSPWEKVQLARHPKRPTMQDYLRMICDEFLELHGDRRFGDDAAVTGGVARIGELRLVVIGHEKGRTTREKLKRNFGMANPEGFRKALRLMKLADKFSLPVLSFIDTPGAYPGVGAEERGQAQAIAENLKEFFRIRSPIVALIIGEGGSGGALALAVGDRVVMMEHAIYSVISPEGCAAILWKSKEKAPEAAEALKLTAGDCLRLGVVDRIITETCGAAHRNPEENALLVKDVIREELSRLSGVPCDVLLKRREEKYFAMGMFGEGRI
jgi:acetyl-CoA carboxylase carboxyl transferase subunit alpha